MRNYLLLIFLFLIVDAIQAQTEYPYDLIPYRKDTLWGYADTSLKIIIPPQFDEIKFFNDKVTGARKGHKWALIDRSGNPITAYKYELIGDFSEGIAPVMFNKKVGYVNNKGKEIVAPEYKYCEDFSGGLGVIRDSIQGKLLSGVVDRTGKILLPVNFDIITSQFNSGYVALRENDKIYYMDKTGKKLKLPANTEPYLEFAEGTAAVKVQKIISTTHPSLVVTSDTVYYLALINTAGKFVADSIVDASGKSIKLADNCFLAANFTNGFAILQHKIQDYNYFYGSYTADEVAYLNPTGKLSAWYSSGRSFGKNGVAIVTEKGYITAKLIDTTFSVLSSSLSVTDAGVFSEGLLRVKQQGTNTWSYIDKNGSTVLEGLYEETSDFIKGIAVVMLNGKRGCIDKQGRQFWE